MTRSQLISEIMAQVYDVTDDSDAALRRYVNQKLCCNASLPELREIYSTHATQRLVIGARAKKSLLAPIPRPADANGASHPAQSRGASSARD